MTILLSWLLSAVYLTLMILASPWIAWSAIKQGKYREGFGQKLLGRVPKRDGDRCCIWLHAVSVGEVNLLDSTLQALEQSQPTADIVISTTTKTGFDLARRKYAKYSVFYCPLDFRWAVKRAMRRVRPDLLVLAELELWPNLILAAKEQGARVAIINGRLSDNSFCNYLRFRPLVGQLLQQIDLIASQNTETTERFRKLGATHVVTTGSLKFDGATTDRENRRTRELRQLASIADDDLVFLAGSTQAPEEQYAIHAFQNLKAKYPRLRLILVPRHPERFGEVADLLEQSGLPWIRRTDLSERGTTLCAPIAALLVDSIGELGAWWGTATIGLVGGSFGSRGGQNMLEPAAYGVATCFGPNTRNFRDIVQQLLAAGGARVVHNRGELEQFVRSAIDCPEDAQQLGQHARDLVLAQQGATRRTVKLLSSLISESSAKHTDRRNAA